MKKILYTLILISSFATAQIPVVNNIVRSNPLSAAKVANALDAAISYPTTGTNTYAISTAAAFQPYAGGGTYASGDLWKITIGNANSSTTVTLNIDSEGAVAVKDNEGNNPAVGDLKAGGTYLLRHNGTNFRILNLGGGGTGGGGSFNHLIPNVQTGNYTATPGDTIRLIVMRNVSTPMILTLPGSGVIPVGSLIAVLKDSTQGITVQGTPGTVDVIGTATLSGEKEVAVFWQREANKWVRLGEPVTGGSSITAPGSTGYNPFKSAGGGFQSEAGYEYDSAANILKVPNIDLPSGAVIRFNTTDLNVTHTANLLTLSGGDFAVPADPYSESSWNANTTVARKDDIRDKIETIAVGTQHLNVSATAMWRRTTNGCSQLTPTEIGTSVPTIQTLDFDAAADEFAQFQIVLPSKWNNGTVTAKIYWTAASGSGNVIWTVAGLALSDDDALNTSFGTAQSVTDALITANDVHVSSATSAITLAGTPADGDLLYWQISRDADNGSDTLGVDAKLLFVQFIITTDASTDN